MEYLQIMDERQGVHTKVAFATQNQSDSKDK